MLKKGDLVKCSGWNLDDGVVRAIAHSSGTVAKVNRVWAIVEFPGYGGYRVKISALKKVNQNSGGKNDE